ncbi:tRNA pseudouridine(13) synthase TruD [Helicobacter sp. MIT 14-3879]|uniref:tRNA pseudouridine(13) synthase TruD n=1 Tax=Helicobacter sp. MIT 14-3879 TaxID=2040649 RepID=UPI000E1F0BA4|nr:tRNA pseudouridine(13) synthase TruD [Helicobacter sp. MIT 14-3879]RDU64833.1 tRNA pseudouridine(13) synthase TruD [Helicobacter sp. MIT 14-3879]
MEYLNYLNHSPINFYFVKNSKNFVVEEIPLYNFSGSGEHLILKVRKKNISTNEMLNIFSKNLNIKRNEIGYAGLKDKHSLSIQYISINKKFTKNIEKLDIENIKILDSTYHNNKLKLGHLSGNKFYIRIKKLNFVDANKIQEVCKIISQNGMPNYFGIQRFGKNKDNYKEGRDILEGKLKIRDKKISKFLISSFQSYLFNNWLKDRIKFCKILESFNPKEIQTMLKKDITLSLDEIISLKSQKHFFKILKGDIMRFYPNGKLYYKDNKDILEVERFNLRELVPTGLLCGSKTIKSNNLAAFFENKFIDNLLDKELGDRRFAWVFVENLKFRYKKEIANGEFNFTLPKGSYATIFLNILSNNLKILESNIS